MKKILLIMLIFSIGIGSNYKLSAEEVDEGILKTNFINNSGRDFWFTIPPAYVEFPGPGDFIKIFVFSEEDTEVSVTVPGKGFHEIKKIQANKVTAFNVVPSIGQVKIYNYDTDGPLIGKVWKNYGVNVSSPKHITCYVMVKYQYSSDGFLALPTNALGKDYVATPYSSRIISNNSLPNMLGIVATENGTKVKFKLGGYNGTIVPLEGRELQSGETAEFTLQRGDVIILSNKGGAETLSGSYISANKNFAVLSGHHCADIPIDNRSCSYNIEMDMPMKTWGKYYMIPQIANRKYSGILRIFAKEDNTIVYRDGVELALIEKGKGGVLGEGWMERRIWQAIVPAADTKGIAVYSGDKPINVMFYNPGTQEDTGNGWAQTDPFSMQIVTNEQFMNQATFATPAVAGGKSFSNNYIALVYAVNEFGQQPDDLEIASLSDGKFNWKPIANEGGDKKFIKSSEILPTMPDKLINMNYAYKVIAINEGVYKIRADKPFMAYSYGFDPYDSYGYPAMAGVRDLTSEDAIAPIVNYEMSPNGCIKNASVTDLPEDDYIRSNLYDIRIIADESFNVGDIKFSPTIVPSVKVLPDGTEMASWELCVEDNTKDAKASILFIDRAGNTTKEVIEYIATSVSEQHKYAKHFNIYPNPVREYLSVEFGAKLNAEYVLELTDNQGKVMFTTQSYQSLKIKMDKFAKGMYNLRISNMAGEIIKNEKIIRE